ncbi:MAG: thioesterase [Herpetosiphonaceae bacterium]|nr:MAG: thioesterase [Herpetosiphonaceae bacterium]
MTERALQDQLGDLWAVCFGCGPQNEHGLRIKSYWSGDESVCAWQPADYHAATPGILNGGIIASIIDCHCVWTAIAYAYQCEGREVGSEPPILYVTSSLHVDYLKPTPMNGPVTLRARIKEVQGKKTTVTCSLFAGDVETVRGEVVAARVSVEWQGRK